MGKSSISVGDDTPTGEPNDAPEGPYITDEDDGSRPRKRHPSADDAGAKPSPDKRTGGDK